LAKLGQQKVNPALHHSWPDEDLRWKNGMTDCRERFLVNNGYQKLDKLTKKELYSKILQIKNVITSEFQKYLLHFSFADV
jgi:hypothetical protein